MGAGIGRPGRYICSGRGVWQGRGLGRHANRPCPALPAAGKIYAFNEGNYQLWSEEQRQYIDSLKNPELWGGKPYSARYIGSLVGDFHRTLLYGERRAACRTKAAVSRMLCPGCAALVVVSRLLRFGCSAPSWLAEHAARSRQAACPWPRNRAAALVHCQLACKISQLGGVLRHRAAVAAKVVF